MDLSVMTRAAQAPARGFAGDCPPDRQPDDSTDQLLGALRLHIAGLSASAEPAVEALVAELIDTANEIEAILGHRTRSIAS